jgi:hypothetical protein
MMYLMAARSYVIRVTFCLISILSVIGMTGCWGEPTDPIDAIYSYNAEIESTITRTLIAGDSMIDTLHVNEITYDEYWDDCRTPVTAVKLSGTKPPSWINYSAGQVLSFSDQANIANEESVSFIIQLPHSYKEESGVELHVHYVLPVAAGGNNVRWQVDYAWADIGEAIAASPTLYCLTNGAALADTHYRASFGFISDPTGKKISSMIIGTLQRNSSNALDNYAGPVYLLEIDAHFQQDSPGSLTEDSK